MKSDLFSIDVPNLFPFLDTVLQEGGAHTYGIEGTANPFHNLFGYSGFDYQEGEAKGQLAFGLILGGTGYVIRRIYKDLNGESERHDYFNLQGDITFTSDKEALKVLIPDALDMDLTCPILNHLYNYLSFEYLQANEGKSRTEQVHSVERYLNHLYRSDKVQLPIKKWGQDPAIATIFNKMLKAEMDPVLSWEERQVVFSNYRQTMNKIARTKVRAHKLSRFYFSLIIFFKNVNNFFTRFIARPGDNTKGILYRYTIGKIIWFFDTVKNNLGYSVALAVYGPFTYYFITMPMNPHAMQAVGKVRAAYLETKHELVSLFEGSSVVINDISNKEAIASSESDNPQDSVSTSASAPVKNTKMDPALANIIYPSAIVSGEVLYTKNNVKPTIANILVSTDIDSVNKQKWSERMSNFKQMQIAYEENIEMASRMGRLEQLETQYNFPMQVEATWEELERYNNMIFKLRQENPNLSAKMKQFLFNEVDRTQQLQVYLWDRLGRFILDQIYVMLDQDKEQKRNDYYVGRSFVFMQEMTNILSWRYKDLKKPEGYERIERLAKFYDSNRKEMGTVMQNLAANSDLFKQKDIFSTAEFRKNIKRQWEILFLQNAKAEEASNMGLNMYIWSVRNTAWILQSIYSAKREELALLIKRDTTGQIFTPAEMLTRSKLSMLYETLFHNLTLEYVGIREEIMNRLSKDIESVQRMTVIENLKEFLLDREKLDGLAQAVAKKTTGEGKTL